MLGVFVADVHFGENRLLVSNDDPDVLSVLREKGANFIGLDPRCYDGSRDNVAFHFNSKGRIGEFYSKWGIRVGNSAVKAVPTMVRSFGREGVVAYLRGYFDCESYADDGGIEVASASQKLLQETQLLLQQFGIFSVIRKKAASNYPENDYWRLTLLGGDFRKFIDVIGCRSSKVRGRYNKALEGMEGKVPNTHRHSIPNMGHVLRDLYDSCGETTRSEYTVFANAMGHLDGGDSENLLTYTRLGDIITCASKGCWDKGILSRLKEIMDANYYYDRVESVQYAGEKPTFDLEMPESHSFIANGFVTHNSSLGYTSAGWATGVAGIPTAFMDHEGTTDKAYTIRLGMDYNKVLYERPETGEWTYDWIDDFCQKLPDKHSGKAQAIVFIDTIKMMKPQKWLDDPQNKMPAQQASMHHRGWARIGTLLSNKHVSIVAANQVTSNVGNPYGAAEVVPGGNAWEFATTNLVRVGRDGKNIELPDGRVLQPVKFKTYKNKNFIPMQECTVHLDLGRGFDIASDVIGFCKMAGYFDKRDRTPSGKPKGPPLLRGLDKFVPGVDQQYKSAAELEAAIYEGGRDGPIFRACQMALRSGDAIERYMKMRRDEDLEDEEEKGEVTLLGVEKEKRSAIDNGKVYVSNTPEEEPEETPVEPNEDVQAKPAASTGSKKPRVGRRKKATPKTE